MKLVVSLLILLVSISFVTSKTFTRESFMEGERLNLADSSGGLIIDTSHSSLINLYNDFPESSNSANADVIFRANDSLTFFWASPQDGYIFKRDVILTDFSSQYQSNAQVVTDYNPSTFNYLNSAGTINTVISFIETSPHDDLDVSLVLFNGNEKIVVDSSRGGNRRGRMASSLTQVSEDTFLIANSVNDSLLYLRKIHSDGITISVESEVEVTRNSTGQIDNRISNCYVAVDSSGNALVTWTQGDLFGDKYLHVKGFTADLVETFHHSEVITVSDNYFHFTSDAPAVAIGNNRFAIATWDESGVLLHTVTAQEVETKRVIHATGIKHVAITTNGQHLAVVYRDTHNESIKAVRYVTKNGEVLDTTKEQYEISKGTVDLKEDNANTYTSAALNSAMDRNGSIAAVWRNGEIIEGGVLGRRFIRYSSGQYVSPVEEIGVFSGDSVRFYPATIMIDSLSPYWSVTGKIRFGTSSEEIINKGWVSLMDSSELYQARGVYSHFQYKIDIVTTDTLSTPLLKRVTIDWNSKPVITNAEVYINDNSIGTISNGDEVTVFSRKDKAQIHFSVRDGREEEWIQFLTKTPQHDTTFYVHSDSPIYSGYTEIENFAVSDTSYEITIEAKDSFNWNAVPLQFSFRTRNSIPKLHLKAKDSSVIKDGTTILFQEDDSLMITMGVSDTNDPLTVTAYAIILSDEKPDTIGHTSGSEPPVLMMLSAEQFSKPKELKIVASDPDTVVVTMCSIRVNHIPEIKYVTIDDKKYKNRDTVRIIPGREFELSIKTDDPDLLYGDTLTYTNSLSDLFIRTVQPLLKKKITPQAEDPYLTIKVSDTHNRTDSVRVYYKYPQYQSESPSHDYLYGKGKLRDGISLIHGSLDTANVSLPLQNSGSDTLSITSVSFGNESYQWLSFAVLYDEDTQVFNSKTIDEFSPLVIGAGDTIPFRINLTADGLKGDGVVDDTIFIHTSDPRNSIDTIPIRFEHNDLPRIVSVEVLFDKSVLNKTQQSTSYDFPPHGLISVLFSEPIDSISAQNGISLFSYFDLKKSGVDNPISTYHNWNSDYTRLNIRANYTDSSSHFGLKPPAGMFIPTDSIHLAINQGVSDLAQTPSGPNALDILQINERVSESDTTFAFRIDSIPFRVTSLSPSHASFNVTNTFGISIEFSSPVDPASVDTSLSENKTLQVYSSMSKDELVSFDSIDVTENIITAYPSRRFFYGDTIFCRFNSSGVKDFLGYTTDNTGDGISMPLIDPDSPADDIEWHFIIQNNDIVTVTPVEGSAVDEISPEITITFSHPIFPGTFDTDTTANNKSFSLSSRFGEDDISFSDITISDCSTEVTIVPDRRFFADDSVLCHFKGFTSPFDYLSENNLPLNNLKGEYQWYFTTSGTGFYTYPNPYRPSKDPRHCIENGPCGIWFKNLHLIDPEKNDLRIKIFTIKAIPVFDTQRAGISLNFDPDNQFVEPQWLWDTKNQSGTKVSSGVYFYLIYDSDGSALKRGKVMIVR
ncbi:Ig-like domain-containing protein [Chitinispirillales bacterium ANBcel5]|uniref:Ig-like domain-containing protein n=1 Tax=Cellulosispirillum alkaliphilum TaxID=3039283 RepID=UPI002A5006F1|nr:Ig-like domain-containing protein [Chitinispirillales bacterium ANBcel5]